MPNESGLTTLADFARKPVLLGNPPVLLFTEDGRKIDREILALAMQVRQAEATERLAAAIEAQTQLLAAGGQEGQAS